MKDLLRKCYLQGNISGANASLYGNRIAVIQQILNGETSFTYGDLASLTEWAIGAVGATGVENQLVALEEAFCQTDPDYSNGSDGNQTELHILVGLLIYQYCRKTNNLLLPSIVVCGHLVGWKLQSRTLYEKFLAFINETRVDLRRLDSQMFVDGAEERNSLLILKAQIEADETQKEEQEKDTEPDETQEENTEAGIEPDELEAMEEQLRILSLQNRKLTFALSVQREESDILWWMLAEWSETCQKLYRDMTRAEAALFSAYELNSIVKLPLGPYASKQVLVKMISLSKAEDSEVLSVTALIDRLDGEALPPLEKGTITRLQPILSALSAKKKAAQRGRGSEWRQYYELTCDKNLDSIMLTPVEFGQQIYLELELAELFGMEGINGELNG